MKGSQKSIAALGAGVGILAFSNRFFNSQINFKSDPVRFSSVPVGNVTPLVKILIVKICRFANIPGT